MREVSKKVLIATIFLALGASTAASADDIDRGGDTGNGGNGGSTLMNVPNYSPMHAAPWCNAVSGMLADALRWSEMSDSVAMARKYLVESTQNILAALNDGTVQPEPLTYSLLKRVLEVNRVFPGTDLGDQSAEIFLYQMLSAAKTISATFDVPHSIPMHANYGRCHHIYCDGDDAGFYGPLYTDYLSSVEVVLNTFFSPALPNTPERGNVLDAMGSDIWELNALSDVLGWIVDDISSDVFGRRQFECLVIQIEMAKQRVDNYLSGQQTLPFNDRRMRMYAESILRDTLVELNHYEYNGQGGICR